MCNLQSNHLGSSDTLDDRVVPGKRAAVNSAARFPNGCLVRPREPIPELGVCEVRTTSSEVPAGKKTAGVA